MISALPPLYAEVMNASALICTSCLEEEAPIGFLIRWTPDPLGGDWLSRAGLDAIPWSALMPGPDVHSGTFHLEHKCKHGPGKSYWGSLMSLRDLFPGMAGVDSFGDPFM